MKKILIYVWVICCALSWRISFSAPMPQIGPMTIKGMIQKIDWIPEKFIKKISGSSGTLGKDRKIPAHYRLTLIHIHVTDRKVAYRNKAYPAGETIDLTLYHDQDDGFLKKGMVIKIYGYQVNSDEGGDWYSFQKIEIIRE